MKEKKSFDLDTKVILCLKENFGSVSLLGAKIRKENKLLMLERSNKRL